jgi:uncharacterized damage-inducible protein DinB
MISKQDFLKMYQKEFATTIKVMKAFPENKLDFSPHERSSTAKVLMSTFIFEMYLLELHIFGKQMDNSAFQSYSPGNLQTLIADFEKESNFVISKLQDLPEKDLTKTVEFAGHKFVADEFMLMMLFDQIHHRGQMSVYIRMAGGKIPSIYGPSADDKTTNL